MSIMESVPAAGDECFRCGYDLRGIAIDQPCPECGLLAERSRRLTDELHNSRPRWLWRLSRGIWIILVANVGAVVWPGLNAILVQTLFAMYTWPYPRWLMALSQRSGIIGFDVAALLLLIAALLVTTPEGHAPADRADFKRRLLLRLWATIPLLALLFQHVIIELAAGRRTAIGLSRQQSNLLRQLGFVVPILLTLGCVPLPMLLFNQLRSLAKRARSAHLAEHCAIVGISTSITLLYVGAMAFVFETAHRWARDSYWTTRGNASLVLMLILSLLGTMIVLWSLYLLVRFAIAFGKASRELRRKWQLHDRARAE